MKARLKAAQSAILSLVAAFLLISPVYAQDNSSALNAGYHNVHIGVKDIDEAIAWYQEHLPMNATQGSPYASYGGTTIALVKTDTAALPSEGTGINRIGLTVTDVDATVTKMAASGAKVLVQARDLAGLYRHAIVVDPFGVTIELVEDQGEPRFHHVYLRSPDPAATLDWYESLVGGTRGKFKGKIEGLSYAQAQDAGPGTIWLFIEPSNGKPLAPTADRAIRNIAFGITDTDATVARFNAKGAKHLSGPDNFRDILIVTFFADPNGVSVELMDFMQ
tara:strand:+ start:594 stop:1424 length:831 start_codon:yes stop_codon:yes gene_type:complete